jgi:membrane-associated protease RseP (regulator of RpoE activity)
MRTILTLTFGVALLVCGCASNRQQQTKTKPIFERPWIGGKFETVATPASIRTNSAGYRKRGALVTKVHNDSPLAKAGLQEGDLILRVNGENVRFENDIRERIDRSQSQPVAFTVYRAGEISEKSITPGVERFQKLNMIIFGLGFRTKYEFDLWPNPDFSLIALGYDVKRDRLDLRDPKSKYRQGLEGTDGKPDEQKEWIGLRSDEGRFAWLGPIWWAQNKMIVSQESAR